MNLNLKELQARALGLRIDSMRATTASKSGHPTSCFSATDMVSTLFFHAMKSDFRNPHNRTNDRFIISKGHAVPVVYAAYKQLGIISDEKLLTLRKVDSPLEGHPTPRFPYNEAATGSLGQGLGIGVGMALQARMDALSFQTFVMLGDGEIAEGSVWEAAEFAGHNNLNNLTALIDCNRLGQSDSTVAAHDVARIAAKFAAFGWHTIIVDGHDITVIAHALDEARAHTAAPTVIVAKTLKGFGLEAIQDKMGYHGKPFTEQECTDAIATLKNRFPLDTALLETLEPIFKEIPAVTTAPRDAFKPVELTNDSQKDLFAKDKKMAPRKAYGHALAALGKANDHVVVLDADVKNSTHADIFEKDFPKNFVQCYIAEQNMVSISTGLISRGKIAFCATFGAFFSRAHDQIRMATIGQVPLRLCGSHCGVSIGEDGPSQMALEDIGLMRALPGSVVLYPSDAVSAYALTSLMADYDNGISFLRTTRENLPVLYNLDEKFEIGGSKILKQSSSDQVCIIAAGITLHEALKAHELLAADGINATVIDLYSIKPLDATTIIAAAEKARNKILTVEDHYSEGGLGEAVRSALPSNKFVIEHLAVRELSRSGKPQELLALAGIDAAHIVKAVRKLVA